MELKELYQEIILDPAQIQGTKESVTDTIMMLKHTTLYAVIKFIFTRN